jgi:MOSC domain-containing protein YiiM
MTLERIAVGSPQDVTHNGKLVRTSIFKRPVDGPVWVRRHNVEGDRQADLEVHGGEYKAVYAYAAEHYDFWREHLGRELELANFGENLTIRGLDEPSLAIGDVLRIGEAELEVTQPRLPCYKLGIRFGDPRMVKTFTAAGRWGIYFRVRREGRIAVGDAVNVVDRNPDRIPAYDLARVYVSDRGDVATLRRLANLDVLDPSWKAWCSATL